MSTTPLGTRSLKIKIGSTEFNMDVSKCRIVEGADDGDFTSFAQAAAGGARKWTLEFTCTQDPADSSSLWNQVWANPGTTVNVAVNPYGGATYSLANPGLTGTVVIVGPDGDLLGMDADPSATAKATMDLVWTFTGKPVKVTSGSY